MAAMDITEKPLSSRTYGGMSSSERKAQRKKQFLAAGFELFGTTGFRSTTVRSLCKQAKLTDRYFYESFGSLEKLLMAVYEDCMLKLTKEVLSALAETYPKTNASEAIKAGINRYFELLEDSRVARICMVELEGISPEVDALYTSYIRSFGKILNTLASKAYPNWSPNPQEREVIGISLVGALRQSATNWLMTDYQIDRATVVAGTHKLFLGLMNLIEAPGPKTQS